MHAKLDALKQQLAAAGQNGAASDLSALLNGKGGLATGAVAGGLAGLLLGGKKGRKFAKGALKLGGVALAGGLAYKAWRDWQANRPPADQGRGYENPQGTVFLPEDSGARESLSRIVIRAMIAAAKSDGSVTPAERERIYAEIDRMNINAQDLAFIRTEFERPLDINAVARSASTMEKAAEIYAASLLILDPSDEGDQLYLRMLARRLDLDSGLVEHLHANAGRLVETATEAHAI
ncbi:tellurite resistance TerB family protein [Hyphococcus sp.]|uniref:tellurite resistance TerB family protein n=1 Tax=Hyphococcus sp. TaxID=2038636 RepID=UPI003D0C444B